jgi:hypothetical protein
MLICFSVSNEKFLKGNYFIFFHFCVKTLFLGALLKAVFPYGLDTALPHAFLLANIWHMASNYYIEFR